MELKELYKAYQKAGNSETYEQFVDAKNQMGDEEFFNYVNDVIGLKKKESGDEVEPSASKDGEEHPPIAPNILSTPISTKLEMNPAQQQILSQEQSQYDSSVSDTTAEPPSTASASATGVSSSIENTDQNIINPPDKPQIEIKDNPNASILMPGTGMVDETKATDIINTSMAKYMSRRIHNENKALTSIDDYYTNIEKPQIVAPASIESLPFKTNKNGEALLPIMTDDVEGSISQVKLDKFKVLGQDTSGNYIFSPKNTPDVALVYKEGKLVIPTPDGKELVYGKDFKVTPNGNLYTSEWFTDEEQKPYQNEPKPLNEIPYINKGYQFHYEGGKTLTGAQGDATAKDFNDRYLNNPDYKVVTDRQGQPIKEEDGSYVFEVVSDKEVQRINSEIQKTNQSIQKENELNGFSSKDVFGNEDRYYLEQKQLRAAEEGARISQQEYDKQVQEFGKEVVDAYGGLLTYEEQEVEKIKQKQRRLMGLGYDEAQALAIAEEEQAKQKQNELRKSQDAVNYISNIAQQSASGEYNSSLVKYGEDTQFTASEQKVWADIAQNPLFGKFMDEIGYKLFGNPDKGLEINAATTTLRKRIVDTFYAYQMERYNDYSRALVDLRGNQAKQNVRNAIKEDNGKAIYNTQKAYEPIRNHLSIASELTQELAEKQKAYDKGFDIDYKRNLDAIKEYEDYDGSTIGAKLIGKNILNGVYNVASDVVLGLMYPFSSNERVGTYLSAADHTTKDLFKVINEGASERYEVFKDDQGNQYKRVNGRVYNLDKDGKIHYNEDLTYDQNSLSQFKKIDEGKDFNAAGIARLITNQIGMMYGAESVAGKLATRTVGAVGSMRYARNVAKAIEVLGKESRLVKNMNLYNSVKGVYSSAAWGEMVAKSNFVEAKNAGLDNKQAFAYAMFQNIGTMALIHVSPDAKFFKEYESASKDLIQLISKNKWQEAGLRASATLKTIGSGIRSENLQEITEQVYSDIVNVATNTIMEGDKLDAFSFDTYAQTVQDTTLVTGFLGGTNAMLRKGKSNVQINIDHLNKLQQYIVASQTPNIEAYLDEMKSGGLFGYTEKQVDETKAAIAKARKYIDQLPPGTQLNVMQAEQLVLSMERIDEYKQTLNKTDNEVIKEELQRKIDKENDFLRTVLQEDYSAGQDTNETMAGDENPTMANDTPNEETPTTTEENIIPTTPEDIANSNSTVDDEVVETPNEGDTPIGNNPDEPIVNEDASLIDDTQNEGANVEPNDTSIESKDTAPIYDGEVDEETEDDLLQSIINNPAFQSEENETPATENLKDENVVLPNNENLEQGTEVDPKANCTLPGQAYTTGNDKYVVTQDEATGAIEVIDQETNQPAEISEKTKQKYLLERVKNTQYPETEIPPEVTTSEDVNSILLSESKNPKEVAAILATTPKYIDLTGTKQWHIAEEIGKVSKKSFIRFGDRNQITMGLAKAYFAKKSEENNETNIDRIAFRASSNFADGNYGNDEITTQDVVDFMLEYPNGVESFYRQKTETYQAAEHKFRELTGLNPTPNRIREILDSTEVVDEQTEALDRAKAEEEYDRISSEEKDNLYNEYNNWLNSLSLKEQSKELERYGEESYHGTVRETGAETRPEEISDQERDGNTNANEERTRQEGARETPAGNPTEDDGLAFQKGNKTDVTPISESDFWKLIDRLKKPFAKAFKNLNVTTDWDAFVARSKVLKNSIDDTKIAYAKQLAKVNNEFNRNLQKLINGTLPKGFIFQLGKPSAILQASGIPNLPIELLANKLKGKSEQKEHPFDLDNVTNLSSAIQNPLAVFNSTTVKGRKVIFTELQQGNKNFVVALELNFKKGKVEVNDVRSVYPRNNSKIIKSLSNNEAVYIQKQKMLEWVSRQQSNSAEATNQPNIDTNISKKIESAKQSIQDFKNPKLDNNQSEMQYMHTATGEVYGAKLPDGTIYINPNKLNANTPFHEFSHLWEQLMPKAWEKGVALFKQTQTGKKLFEQLKNDGNYNNLTEDQLWSEALNTHLGNYGEWQYYNPKGKMQALKEWFVGLVNKIGQYFGIKNINPDMALEAFTQQVIGDLTSGKELSTDRYLNGMSDVELKNLLHDMGLVEPAKCA